MTSRDEAIKLFNVSRETLTKFDALVDLVGEWQKVKNLIAPSTMPDIWVRHIADSAQLHDLAPCDGDWLDLGSGGGFPGLVIAAMLSPGRSMHLVESDRRKCAFLQHAATALELPVVVHPGRIHVVLESLSGPFSVVSARALANLEQLLDWTSPLIEQGALGIFPKGQDVEVELGHGSRYGQYQFDQVPSVTNSAARIILVRRRSTT